MLIHVHALEPQTINTPRSKLDRSKLDRMVLIIYCKQMRLQRHLLRRQETIFDVNKIRVFKSMNV